MSKYHFERISQGQTFKVKGLPGDHDRMYITINEESGAPFEVFVRYDSHEHFELINVIARLSSMALREGVPLDVVARELKDIHSPETHHIVPGTSRTCPSITARIGEMLDKYFEQQQLKKEAA